MFNFRLKSYGNGTAQLTYFHNPILMKEDRYKIRPATYLESIPDEQYNKLMTDDMDDHFFYIHHETYLEYLDKFAVIKNVLPAEVMIETPFGEYGKLPDLPPEDVDMINILTPEEIEERKEHSLNSSINRTKKMIYDYGRGNVWEWFITLTFKPVEEFNTENFEECKKKVTKWFKNVRANYCKDIKYLIVPEMHTSGAWHFHCLVSNCDELDFDIAVNQRRYLKDKNGEYILDKYGARVPNKYFGQELRTSYPDGQYIYNIRQYKNGWTTATKIADTHKAVSYVIKYVTKDLCEIAFGKRRYLPSNNLEMPIITTGLVDNNYLQQIITDIEYKFGLKLSIDNVKTYPIEVPNYSNMVTVFEFGLPDIIGTDEFENRAIRLNEIVEDWYE